MQADIQTVQEFEFCNQHQLPRPAVRQYRQENLKEGPDWVKIGSAIVLKPSGVAQLEKAFLSEKEKAPELPKTIALVVRKLPANR